MSNYDEDRIKFYKEELQNEIKSVTAFIFSATLAGVSFFIRPIESIELVWSYLLGFGIFTATILLGIYLINNKKSKNMKKIHELYAKIEKGQKLEIDDF